MKNFMLFLMTLFLSCHVMAQQTTVTGTITDGTDGSPLIGANVLVKGTGTGSIADVNGKFSVSVPTGKDVLVISCIGYKQQEITLKAGQKVVNVVMKEDSELLDEVVVVGYGTMKKSDLSGASVSMGEDKIKGSIITNLDQSLQGRAAGVTAVSYTHLDVYKRQILILVNGRPLGVQWAAENLPAIVEAWAPGMYGGQAVAEILYGQVNPSAKLAVTIPYSVGQLQMIYNHKPSQYFHPYAAGKPSTPLYPFGHGLSYTTYKYDDLKLAQKEITKDGTVDVSVKVTNTGDRDGVEIVQLYIRDKFSSVTRPVKELKDFARVPLKAGESQVVNFKITPDKMAFYDKKMKKIVEPGEFIVMVGASSDDKDLLKDSFFVK